MPSDPTPPDKRRYGLLGRLASETDRERIQAKAAKRLAAKRRPGCKKGGRTHAKQAKAEAEKREAERLISLLQRDPNRGLRAIRKQGHQEKRVSYGDADMIRALERARGNMTQAARILGCHRETVSSRCRTSPEVRGALRVIEETNKDVAEHALLDLVEERHPSSVAFYLQTQAKDRGYVRTVEQTGPGGGPIQSVHLQAVKLLSDEELRTMRSKLRAPDRLQEGV